MTRSMAVNISHGRALCPARIYPRPSVGALFKVYGVLLSFSAKPFGDIVPYSLTVLRWMDSPEVSTREHCWRGAQSVHLTPGQGWQTKPASTDSGSSGLAVNY